MTRNAFQTYSHLSIINSGAMDTHVDSHTYTKKLRVNLYVYHILFPLLRDILTKLEERSLAPMWNNFLFTSHQLSSLLVCLHSSFMYTGIPVTESQSVWPDENGYRYTEWALSLYLFIVKEQNPILESSPLLDTLSNVPRTYFTNSHLRENSSKNQSTSSCVK